MQVIEIFNFSIAKYTFLLQNAQKALKKPGMKFGKLTKYQADKKHQLFGNLTRSKKKTLYLLFDKLTKYTDTKLFTDFWQADKRPLPKIGKAF